MFILALGESVKTLTDLYRGHVIFSLMSGHDCFFACLLRLVLYPYKNLPIL